MSSAPILDDDSWRKMTPQEYLEWEAMDRLIELTSVGCEPRVADVYRRVEFDNEPKTSEEL